MCGRWRVCGPRTVFIGRFGRVSVLLVYVFVPQNSCYVARISGEINAGTETLPRANERYPFGASVKHNFTLSVINVFFDKLSLCLA